MTLTIRSLVLFTPKQTFQVMESDALGKYKAEFTKPHMLLSALVSAHSAI